MRGMGEHLDRWSQKALVNQGQNCQSIISVILIRVCHDAGDFRHGQVGPLAPFALVFLSATALSTEHNIFRIPGGNDWHFDFGLWQ